MVFISVGPLCVENFSLSSFVYLQYLSKCLGNSICLRPGLLPYLDNRLSSYIIVINVGKNPGPRHIEFPKHLLQYCKYAKLDRLKTMSLVLQLKFQCDADLGGNKDNEDCQTLHIGYLGESVICWCSTDQCLWC